MRKKREKWIRCRDIISTFDCEYACLLSEGVFNNDFIEFSFIPDDWINMWFVNSYTRYSAFARHSATNAIFLYLFKKSILQNMRTFYWQEFFFLLLPNEQFYAFQVHFFFSSHLKWLKIQKVEVFITSKGATFNLKKKESVAKENIYDYIQGFESVLSLFCSNAVMSQKEKICKSNLQLEICLIFKSIRLSFQCKYVNAIESEWIRRNMFFVELLKNEKWRSRNHLNGLKWNCTVIVIFRLNR